jgi:hypothetical protein
VPLGLECLEVKRNESNKQRRRQALRLKTKGT